MKIIGITGRSGCGKSTVTNFLRKNGCACIDADEISRQIYLPGSPCLAQMQQAFGADILDEQGNLLRRKLAERAFATPEGTKKLTDIAWPEILHRTQEQISAAEKAGADLVFVDGAVIVGTPFQKCCDLLVVVAAPYEQSVARICARDGITPESAKKRLDAQTSEAVLRAAADYVIENDDTPEILESKCSQMLNWLRQECHEN